MRKRFSFVEFILIKDDSGLIFRSTFDYRFKNLLKISKSNPHHNNNNPKKIYNEFSPKKLDK